MAKSLSSEQSPANKYHKDLEKHKLSSQRHHLFPVLFLFAFDQFDINHGAGMSFISKMLEITNLNISLTAFPGTALHFPSQSLATPRLNPEPDFLPVVLLL